MLLVMVIIRGKLFVERQGWQRQRCSRNAACLDKTHTLQRYMQHVWPRLKMVTTGHTVSAKYQHVIMLACCLEPLD